MNIDNSENDGNKYFIDFLANIKEVESIFLHLSEKVKEQDSLKHDEVIEGFRRLKMFTYAFTNEDLLKYPDEFLLRIRKPFTLNFGEIINDLNSKSKNIYDGFLFILKEPLDIVNALLNSTLLLKKQLVKELPNSYDKIDDFDFLAKHKKHIINLEYSLKEHFNLNNVGFLEFLKSHISEQQNVLMYRSTQKPNSDIVVNEAPSNSPFTSLENLKLFHFIEERLKIGGEISRYSYILNLFRDTLDEKTTETKYFNYVNSLEKNQGKKISIQYNISTRNRIGKEIYRLYEEFLKINKS